MPRLSNSARILSNHSFSGLQWSPHMHISTLLNSQEGPSTDLQSSFPCNSFSPSLCYANSLPSVLPNFQLSLSFFFCHTSLHMGSQFPNQEWNWAPCIASTESQLLPHQKSPSALSPQLRKSAKLSMVTSFMCYSLEALSRQ